MIRLEDLEAMDRVDLLDTWSGVFGRPAPKGLSQGMMRRFLAHEVQIRRLGGLNRKAKAALSRANDTPVKPVAPSLQPGSRLLREWNGITHVVDVTETGFDWRGKNWRSLSAIAREITGAHWSGPRFFGLTKASA